MGYHEAPIMVFLKGFLEICVPGGIPTVRCNVNNQQDVTPVVHQWPLPPIGGLHVLCISPAQSIASWRYSPPLERRKRTCVNAFTA